MVLALDDHDCRKSRGRERVRERGGSGEARERATEVLRLDVGQAALPLRLALPTQARRAAAERPPSAKPSLRPRQ